MKRAFFAAVVLASTSGWVAGASAAPIYVGLSSGTATPTTTLTGSGGAPSSSNYANGTFTFPITGSGLPSGLYASGTVTGTPPEPEPNLVTTTLDFSGSGNANTATFSLYVTELNQETLNFNAFISSFSAVFLPADLPPTGLAAASITESTYVTTCTTLVNNGCAASYAFATQDLLSTVTYSSITSTPTTTVDAAAVPGNLALPFATTEVFTVTFDPKYGDVQANIDLAVPEPASLALLGSACVGLGLIRRRRKTPPTSQA